MVFSHYALTAEVQELAQRFQLTHCLPLIKRYNIRTGSYVPVICGNRMEWARWGREKFIHLRWETILSSAYWRKEFLKNKCLIPANAVYEWRFVARTKRPYAICLPARSLFAMIGLLVKTPEDFITEQKNQHDKTVVILTHPASLNRLQRPGNDAPRRLPLIFTPALDEVWKHPFKAGKNIKESKEWFATYQQSFENSADGFQEYPVSTALARLDFDGPACLEPLGPSNSR